MKRMVTDGEISPLNRNRDEILRSKSKKTGVQASKWYLKGVTSRSIKYHPTPGGLLAKNLNRALNPEGIKERTHIMEEGGIPVI